MCLILQISSRNSLFEMLLWIHFFFKLLIIYFTFYFIFVYFSNFRGSKNRGSMDPVHILMDLVHGPGPWTRSTEGVHGPGVHVLYFPQGKQWVLFPREFKLLNGDSDRRASLPNASQRSISSAKWKAFYNRPFPSSLVPALFQNESKCETFQMKMSPACSFIFIQIKVIFTRIVSHLHSLWNRGTNELGTDGLSNMIRSLGDKLLIWFKMVFGVTFS